MDEQHPQERRGPGRPPVGPRLVARVPEPELAALRQLAETNGRALAEEVRDAVTSHLRAHERATA